MMWRAAAARMAIAPPGRALAAAAITCLLAAACAVSPAAPTTLSAGRWTGDGACLSIADGQCDLVAGCGHGQFAAPTLGADGAFSVDGTYRVEVGPVSIDPPPPATFSDVLRDGTLTLIVTPRDAAVRPPPLVLHPTNMAGRCAVPCV